MHFVAEKVIEGWATTHSESPRRTRTYVGDSLGSPRDARIIGVMRIGSGFVILASALAVARCQTPMARPLIAFSSGNSVVLVTKAGDVVSTIKLPIKVGEFSFSPDLKKLVVVSPHPAKSGGKMYLYSVESKQLQQIPVHAVIPESAMSEVYSEPQFSADGTELFFNTHPQADGDLAETNGPIAELDLKTLRAGALEWTNGLLTDGFVLSPNGRGLLLWDEEKVIDKNGTTLFDIHDFQLGEQFKWALNEAWIGERCVLYQAGRQSNRHLKDQISFFVLDLKSLKSTRASEALGLSDQELEGFVSYTYPYGIVKYTPESAGDRGTGYFLVSPGGTRTKLTLADATVIQVLPNNPSGGLPVACK